MSSSWYRWTNAMNYRWPSLLRKFNIFFNSQPSGLCSNSFHSYIDMVPYL